MRILIADDDGVTRRILESFLVKLGFEVITARDGNQASQVLFSEDAPSLAILDWNMPEEDGISLCQRVRQEHPERILYIILLTANTRKEHIIEGLDAGANDYITKPFHHGELYARLLVGLRMIELQQKLQVQVDELKEALQRVKQLQDLLPICCYCKRIRNDDDYWQQVDHYMAEQADIKFTHGICPDCYVVAMKKAGLGDKLTSEPTVR